jgi:subtilisin family serine protease
MKRYLLGLFICLLCIGSLFSTTVFDKEIHYEKIIIASFDAKAIGTTRGDLDISYNEAGIVQIGLKSFDELSIEHEFVDITRWITFVKDHEWQNYDGTHVMNVFRIHLKSNDNMEKALIALLKNPDIIWAEYETYMKLCYIPNDPRFSQQWYHPAINTPQLWEYVRGDETLIIGIVDTGTKWNHEDLAANIYVDTEILERDEITINWTEGTLTGSYGGHNSTGFWGNPIGWDFFINDPPIPPELGGNESNNPFQPYPENWHGTHCAGISAAVGDNGIGIAGVAMHARLLTTKHTPSNIEDRYVRNGYAGITYLVDHGARVINCSWGGPGNFGQTNTAANYAQSKGVLIVAAAGNERRNNNITPHYPSDHPLVVGVAASNQSGNKSDFSNWGSQVDITAPGSAILSTAHSGTISNPTDTYVSTQGTSMAAPVVAGVAALIMHVHPYFTPATVKQRIVETATPMPQNEPGGDFAGWLGGGLLNAYKAVLLEKVPSLTLVDDPIVTVLEGSTDGIPRIGDKINISLRIFNEPDWKTAEGVSVELSTVAHYVTIENPIININNIPQESYSNLFSFSVSTAWQLNSIDIPFSLVIRSDQGSTSLFPYTNTVSFNVRLSASAPNWPLALGGSGTAPKVADFGDGLRLVVMGGSTLHMVDSAKNPSPGFPVNLGLFTNTQLAIGDLTGNGTPDIVFVSTNGFVKVVNHAGVVIAERNISATTRSAPVIADIQNTGENTIIVATQNSGIYFLKVEGSDLVDRYDSIALPSGNNILQNIAVEDMTNSGIKNVIVNINSSGTVHVLDPVTGINVTGFPISDVGGSLHGSSIGMFSGSSTPDIVFANHIAEDATVTILKSDGTIHRRVQKPAQVRTELSLVDLYGNGSMNIVYGDSNGRLYALNSDLEVLPGFPINVGHPINSSPIFAETNIDSGMSIIFGDDSGRLHIVRSNGEYGAGFPIRLGNSSISASPWIGRLSDGYTGDILLNVDSGVVNFPYTRYSNSFTWNTFRGNIGNTASFLDIRTSDTDFVRPNVQSRLSQNFPNPFNPETVINFIVSGQDDIHTGNGEVVSVDIFNIKGQKVRTLVSDFMASGEHSVIWNGTDDNGQSVTSGIYFYRLHTNNYTETKKMILMK